jgi:hypothetical protein
MSDSTRWQNLASALRELHRTLMECARRDYERENGMVANPGEFLQLLTTDPHFDWLRGLSELMVDIDVVRDSEPALVDEMSAGVRAAVEHFISAPKTPQSAHAFAQRYWPCVQDDPHVAMAHAGVKRALGELPRPENVDAASLLHERHRLAEKARHASRRK